ncbi:hypothetical protein ACF1BU_25590 [Streptomyces sp. NPDC014724]|uniref:hypothetical protein n=1 Tax=unclassified Streptomyces TaxID=2593676 RepID=UPI0037026AFB
MPDRLCGVRVSPDTLAPLLPDGAEFKEKKYDFSPDRPRCRLIVDKKVVLHIRGDVVSTDTDPFEVRARSLRMGGNPAPATGPLGRDARITDSWAIAVKSCHYQGSPHKYAIEVELTAGKLVPTDTAKRRKALEAFLDGYVPTALKAQGCS